MKVITRKYSRELLSSLISSCLHQYRFHQHRGQSRRLLLSRFFQPMKLRDDRVLGMEGRQTELTCKSQRLMIQAGLIHPANPGCYHYLSYVVRAMEKLIRVIDEEMQAIGGQKINMPSLSSADLWRISQRWEIMGKELFRLKDRHNMDYCLGPTHEEAITDLIASQGNLSYRQLPLLVYQITRKFRDEPKPRFGLLRGREFYMKDMYTFDVSEEAAQQTYSTVCDAYCSLFNRLGLRFVKVQADTGSIGGKMSHEFQLPAEVGEDRLSVCSSCSFSANVETLKPGQADCPECHGKLTETKGIEVGHAFYLGTKYSYIFNASYYNAQNKPVITEMGCFGLGVSRILAASVEVLSSEDSIRWPSLIAPYQVCIIPPKKGSKEEEATVQAESLYDNLVETVPQLKGEVLLDDRVQLTIGKRLKDATKLGYPYVIVAGRRVLDDPPHFEVHCQNTGEQLFLTKEGIFKFLEKVKIV
ncbi:probable proline--tRNA ligase, mitochondrial [Latimeria chalumnae]|uniref:Probable proline--tRNA ligase, mitochondrial n=1 Tax=Latimeria chalumnae TaxID=7897 RepID=H3A726_LATCH|nr:PREDICTED: probable proline--tRNA ligase, mitochondrial [Latimeria chalumnae]XP_006005556.1 PREDICTED: probable proline--tRNA ligase, mitochondrial [Latimeria chalumnae]|eukprot:XP_006005555.1 PREDICTED: probable proline--tRNA ligase, mitochondrial [Latimeria chalumnae]